MRIYSTTLNACKFCRAVAAFARSQVAQRPHLEAFPEQTARERERDFYERVFVSEKDPPEFAALRQFLPEYHGTVVVREVEDAQEVNGLHPGRTWLELRAARFTA